MLIKLSTALISCSLLAATPAPPDEVRLTDGRVLVGKVVKRGDDLEIQTRDGVVRIAATEVETIRTDRELRKMLRQLSQKHGESAFAQLELARTARGYGLDKEMWRHLDACVEALAARDSAAKDSAARDSAAKDSAARDSEAKDSAADNDDAVHRRLRALLVTLQPEVLTAEQRAAGTKDRVKTLVRMVRGNIGPGKRAAITEILSHEQDAADALHKAVIAEPLPEQRLAALEALQRQPGRGYEKFIHERMLWDRDGDARQGTAAIVAEHGDPRGAVLRLAPNLMHQTPAFRIRTAEAYGELGGPEAAVLLALAGPAAGSLATGGGIGTRSSMYKIESRAFIQDFEVEIAQAAAVANPVVGTAKRGVVLDVNVPAVITHRVPIQQAYRQALTRIVGADPGGVPSAWASWLAARDPEAARLMGGG